VLINELIYVFARDVKNISRYQCIENFWNKPS